VPLALKEAWGRKLSRVEELGILEWVEHTDWAAPAVVVPKGDGALRVCGDWNITINAALVVDKYPLPRPDEQIAQLAGGHKFSILHLSQTYQQIKLDNGSCKCVTINTHLELYQYACDWVAFVVESAPALLQKTMDCLLKEYHILYAYLMTYLLQAKHLQNLEVLKTTS